MKTLGKWHLYLSCFFAPWLLFFTLTGVMQTFDLHRNMKTGPDRPWVGTLSRFTNIHVRQSMDVPRPSPWFRLFVAAMSVAFMASTALGVIMAFQRARSSRVVLSVLLAGWILPWMILGWHYYSGDRSPGQKVSPMSQAPASPPP